MSIHISSIKLNIWAINMIFILMGCIVYSLTYFPVPIYNLDLCDIIYCLCLYYNVFYDSDVCDNIYREHAREYIHYHKWDSLIVGLVRHVFIDILPPRLYTEKTIFPFSFTLNGIWSWWQFSFRFWTKCNSIWFKIEKKTVTTIISHSFWKEMEI